MQCRLCNIQYIGKSQTTLAERIAGHRSDVKCKLKPILADAHFRSNGHNFTEHASFIIIEQAKKHRDKEEMHEFLRSLEDIWTLRLNTLSTNGDGLNQKLNIPEKMTEIMFNATKGK